MKESIFVFLITMVFVACSSRSKSAQNKQIMKRMIFLEKIFIPQFSLGILMTLLMRILMKMNLKMGLILLRQIIIILKLIIVPHIRWMLRLKMVWLCRLIFLMVAILMMTILHQKHQILMGNVQLMAKMEKHTLYILTYSCFK